MKKAIKHILLLILLAAAIYGGLCSYEYWQQNRVRVLLDVPQACQHPDYPTGCESIVLYMLLRYYGTEVTPAQIVEALPKGPVPYRKNGRDYGANPEREFVGDPRDPHSYGVYNQPICDTANQFLAGAQTKTGATVDEIKQILDSGAPVMLWYTTQDAVGVEAGSTWLDEQTGEKITWLKYEHAVVACGYKLNDLIINDPNTGTQRTIRFGTVMNAFDRLGGRIVWYPVTSSESS
jgi:uncharacterized protein YvpB